MTHSLDFAFIREREGQKAAIHGCTLQWILRSSVNAKVKKRPSKSAFFCLGPAGMTSPEKRSERCGNPHRPPIKPPLG
jgi:hypothetical protein